MLTYGFIGISKVKEMYGMKRIGTKKNEKGD